MRAQRDRRTRNLFDSIDQTDNEDQIAHLGDNVHKPSFSQNHLDFSDCRPGRLGSFLPQEPPPPGNGNDNEKVVNS